MLGCLYFVEATEGEVTKYRSVANLRIRHFLSSVSLVRISSFPQASVINKFCWLVLSGISFMWHKKLWRRAGEMAPFPSLKLLHSGHV